jgi:hypothetical protein
VHSHRYGTPPPGRPARRSRASFIVAGVIATIVVAGTVAAMAFRPPADLGASAPVDLNAPLGLSPTDLHQWCVDRQAAGTAGLSANAKNWLAGCAEAFGNSPTSTPTTPSTTPATTPTQTPTAPTQTPTSNPAQPPTSTPNSSWPGASTTGTQGTLTAMACPSGGEVVIRTAGYVLQNVDLGNCGIDVQAPNVMIRNVRAESDAADSYLLIVRSGGSATIQDVDLSGVSASSPVEYAILSQEGASVAIQRANLHLCTDCVQGEHVVMTDSYVHDMTNPPGAHPDAFQCNSGCANTVLRHNHIENLTGNNMGISMFCDFGTPVGAIVDDNYVDMGGNGSYAIWACGRNHTITNNVIAPASYGWLGIPTGSGTGYVITGNTRVSGAALVR